MRKKMISICWYRRDLRIKDNHALLKALNSGTPVLPIFIFDKNIIEELDANDARITFIYEQLTLLNKEFKKNNSGIYILIDTPIKAWKKLVSEFIVKEVFFNEDYEPYAIGRDKEIHDFLRDKNIKSTACKDQVIFSGNEVLKADQTPYTIYTPYKNKWREKLHPSLLKTYDSEFGKTYFENNYEIPTISEIGFTLSTKKVKPYNFNSLENYENTRNIPGLNGTSNLSPHLRFGTVSIRQIVNEVKENESFLNELIWREFFMQILFHFPKVINANFKRKYDTVEWRNNEKEFELWKSGNTGYPMVDAGMRELNATGYMHNRVRMIVAGFLCKHLLIDWRWGEAYFAQNLLDYELASNNGNWQWAAGTGCDSAPYFRVFNPTTQLKKFDPDLVYIRKWIPEFDELNYPLPMVEHKMARERAINTYKRGIS
ncbi:cryptochrome/photolyase family protein [Urechidicola vernalis]|uniref:Deoxyribodipyrimidine photo-lyase n=1 Tax=Urechidicola vernalis TaxID=3075600 RepID=A0ABU2Y6X3_9FLAO|nr:deoxyribodipyrimidine photo-lyase [Urechidicola sp. P050]MDT0552793.1 deoxyribodipyrimidine photo-lyase [Urechidicola sp. P050]